MRLLVHPHIVRLYEIKETESHIYVVMEYMKCGELFDYITQKGRIHEDEARHFFQQIISGVEHCHRCKIVHRDLKPENLLLDAKLNVKIADFGLGNIMCDGHFLKTSCGTPNYAAPEVISERLYAGPEVDVWSCGVILYAILCGRLPFDYDNFPALYRRIKNGNYPVPGHLSSGANDLIAKILVTDPVSRISIPEIRQHSWFKVQLPNYISLKPYATASEISEIEKTKVDENVLKEMAKNGFDIRVVIESLYNNAQNEVLNLHIYHFNYDVHNINYRFGTLYFCRHRYRIICFCIVAVNQICVIKATILYNLLQMTTRIIMKYI
nr:SNF1-related protein kinase catalytic subunit alpha KIN10-like isoform X2 [Ipomoea batatas]